MTAAPTNETARRHALALEQCSIFAADVGPNIEKAMLDAAGFLRTLPASNEPALVEALKKISKDTHVDAFNVERSSYAAQIAIAAIAAIASFESSIGTSILLDAPTEKAVKWQRLKPGRTEWQDIADEEVPQQIAMGFGVRALYPSPPIPAAVKDDSALVEFAKDSTEILEVAIDNWNQLHPNEPDEIFTDLRNRAAALANGEIIVATSTPPNKAAMSEELSQLPERILNLLQEYSTMSQEGGHVSELIDPERDSIISLIESAALAVQTDKMLLAKDAIKWELHYQLAAKERDGLRNKLDEIQDAPTEEPVAWMCLAIDSDSSKPEFTNRKNTVATWQKFDNLRLTPLYEAASIPPSADVKVARTLRWYQDQVAACRKLSSEGDKARNALDRDGGKRATAALSSFSAADMSESLTTDAAMREAVSGAINDFIAKDHTTRHLLAVDEVMDAISAIAIIKDFFKSHTAQPDLTALQQVFERWSDGYGFNDDSEEDVALAERAATSLPNNTRKA